MQSWSHLNVYWCCEQNRPYSGLHEYQHCLTLFRPRTTPMTLLSFIEHSYVMHWDPICVPMKDPRHFNVYWSCEKNRLNISGLDVYFHAFSCSTLFSCVCIFSTATNTNGSFTTNDVQPTRSSTRPLFGSKMHYQAIVQYRQEIHHQNRNLMGYKISLNLPYAAPRRLSRVLKKKGPFWSLNRPLLVCTYGSGVYNCRQSRL